MTVGRMLREISSSELTEWMAYYRPEPEKKVNTAEVLKAMFATRIKRNKK
jgi:hypothetical protein